MKTPRECKCELCGVRLTAVQKQVDRDMGRRGRRRMWTLVAPPRIEMTFTVGKDFIRVFLCPSHWSPSHVMVMMDKMLEQGRLGAGFRQSTSGEVVPWEALPLCSNCDQYQRPPTGDCLNECAKRGFATAATFEKK